MNIERLKELVQAEDSDLWDYKVELIGLLDEAIARQSVKSEEVAEAIEVLECIYPSQKEIVSGEYPHVADALDLAITALQAYQPWVSVSERLPDGEIMSMEHAFLVHQIEEDDGTIQWICEFPDLKGCIGVGNTYDEAISEGMLNKEVWIETAKEVGREIPEPTRRARSQQSDSQIDKLANFIMSEVEGEPSQSQGAVDTAIRIIKSYQNQDDQTGGKEITMQNIENPITIDELIDELRSFHTTTRNLIHKQRYTRDKLQEMSLEIANLKTALESEIEVTENLMTRIVKMQNSFEESMKEVTPTGEMDEVGNDLTSLIDAEIEKETTGCHYCIGIESHGIVAVKTVIDEYLRVIPAYDTPYNYCPNCGRKINDQTGGTERKEREIKK